MVDQTPRDAPPAFYIHPDIDYAPYFALLMEPVAKIFDGHFHVSNEDGRHEEVVGQVYRQLTRGLYCFKSIEARDKFVRACNADSELEICIKVHYQSKFTAKPPPKSKAKKNHYEGL